MVRRPQARAWATVGNQRSIVAPWTAEPVSAATPCPYPGIDIRVPSGITDGSTATTPQPTGIPVAVVPTSAYPVALTTIERLPPAPGSVAGAGVGAGAGAGATDGAVTGSA